MNVAVNSQLQLAAENGETIRVWLVSGHKFTGRAGVTLDDNFDLVGCHIGETIVVPEAIVAMERPPR